LPKKPYSWRVLTGRLLIDAGDGPVEVLAHIDHDERRATVSGSVSADRMMNAVGGVMRELDGQTVVSPTIVSSAGHSGLAPAGYTWVSGCFLHRLVPPVTSA
jgi:hypothetical protein